AMFILSLVPTSRVGRLLLPVALLAGAGGAVLIALQLFVLQTTCPVCLLVDGAALGSAFLAWSHVGHGSAVSGERGRVLWPGVGGVVVVFAVAIGIAGVAVRNPVPTEISSRWVNGKVTIVEVADFDCEHCREMHRVLGEAVREVGEERVHLVQFAVPMPQH